MAEIPSATLVITLVICIFGAMFTWFAADQYRNQLLSDSHRLVREMALRYLQGMVISTTLFGLGIVAVIFILISKLLGGGSAGAAPEPAALTATPSPTADPLSGPPTLTPLPSPVPPLATATLTEPETDPTLAAVQSARVEGTDGLGVNLRDAPGLESNVIGIVPESSPVTLLGESDFVDGLNWLSIIGPNGESGWVAELFLVFE
jgi:hypothetical protein